jgi:hypothetical protein
MSFQVLGQLSLALDLLTSWGNKNNLKLSASNWGKLKCHRQKLALQISKETTHKHGVNLNSNFSCFPGSVPDLICEAIPPVLIRYMIRTLYKELAKKQVY